jgi:hypothetical protein
MPTDPLKQNLASLYGVSLAMHSEQLHCVLDKCNTSCIFFFFFSISKLHISNAISIMLIVKLVLIEGGTPSME